MFEDYTGDVTILHDGHIISKAKYCLSPATDKSCALQQSNCFWSACSLFGKIIAVDSPSFQGLEYEMRKLKDVKSHPKRV